MGKGFIPKDGEYYYCLHRRHWCVFQKHVFKNGVSIDDKISEWNTKEEAAAEVRRLNGWSNNN